jgi:nicotinamidase-related amidase
MDVFLVVDMQQGLLRSAPKHDLEGVIKRINSLATKVRARGGRVLFIQHAGNVGDDFEPHTAGWQLLNGLQVEPDDLHISKSLNDPFAHTTLGATLDTLGVTRILVAGWATDFCVDACVRSAIAYGRPVIAVADCHTLSNRPHLTAQRVIDHHHWVWTNLIAPHSVHVIRESEL